MAWALLGHANLSLETFKSDMASLVSFSRRALPRPDNIRELVLNISTERLDAVCRDVEIGRIRD